MAKVSWERFERDPVDQKRHIKVGETQWLLLADPDVFLPPGRSLEEVSAAYEAEIARAAQARKERKKADAAAAASNGTSNVPLSSASGGDRKPLPIKRPDGDPGNIVQISTPEGDGVVG